MSRLIAGRREPSVWRAALESGLAAARSQARPVLALQALVALVVAGEFLSADVDAFLRSAGAALDTLGLPGVFVAAGLTSGLLAEAAVVAVHQQGRWRAWNTPAAAFRFVLFGLNAVVVSVFYRWQAEWFGDSASWPVLLSKLAVEQLLFAPLVCVPLQLGAGRLQALGFDARRLYGELDGAFLRERYLPVLVTQWLFWPAVSLAIYSFPLVMQTPLFLLIGATWALLVVALTRGPAPQPVVAPALP
jgi:hypothetical protein